MWGGCHNSQLHHWLVEKNHCRTFPFHFPNSLLEEWSQDIPSHIPAAALVSGRPPAQCQGLHWTAAADPASSQAHAPLGR